MKHEKNVSFFKMVMYTSKCFKLYKQHIKYKKKIWRKWKNTKCVTKEESRNYKLVTSVLGRDIFRNILSLFLLPNANVVYYKKKMVIMELHMALFDSIWIDLDCARKLFQSSLRSLLLRRSTVNKTMEHYFGYFPSWHHLGGGNMIGNFRFSSVYYLPKTVFRDRSEIETRVDFYFYMVDEDAKAVDDFKVWFQLLLDKLPFVWLWKHEQTKGKNGEWILGFREKNTPIKYSIIKRMDFLV